MSLKKNLKTGQATLEYFILFAAIASITLLSLSSFFPQAKNSSKELFRIAVERILK